MRDTRRFLSFALLAIPLVVGGLVLGWNTRSGLAVYSDSVSYLWAAHSIESGHGFTIPDAEGSYIPVTFFPPLYPMVLAAAGAGTDVMAGARRLQILLELLAVTLAMAFVSIATGGSLAASVAAGMLWALAMDLTVYQSGVLSEGLFVVASALAAVFMLLYLRDLKRSFLIAAALATSAAWMTRFAGMSWMAGGAAGVFLLAHQDLRRRIFDTALFLSVASAINAYWMHRNDRLGSAVLGRPFHWTRFWGAHQLQSIEMTFRWWSWQPNNAHQTAYAIAYGMAFILFLSTWVGEKKSDNPLGPLHTQASRLLLIYSTAYAGLIVVSAICFQGDIFSDSTRLLIPFHLCMLLFVILRIDALLRQPRFKRVRPWMGGACASAVLLGLCAIPSVISKSPNLMYALPTYRESSTIAALRHAPPDQIIYSNLLFPVELYLGHPCREIPHPIDNGTQLPNPRFAIEMMAMKEAMHHDGAVLAHFNTGDTWLVWPRLDEIQATIPLKAIGHYSDGALFVDPYVYSRSSSPRYKFLRWRHPLFTTRSSVLYRATSR